MIKQQILNACRQLLEPVVRLLLRNGVTWNEFSDLSREVFVDVARRDFGIQGRPTNNSRVAMMTGLSRREVTRVCKLLSGQEEPDEGVGNRISQLLSAWHLDPEFLTDDGQPAELPLDGAEGSLETLMKRYAGDLPHGALVKEMQRLGLIEPKAGGYQVLTRHYLRSAVNPDIVRQAGVALHDHGATLIHNVDQMRDDEARFEGMATTLRLAPRHLRAFHDFVSAKGQKLLEEADAWLVKHEIKSTGKAKHSQAVRAGLGVYLIQDEIRRGRENDE